MAGSAQRRFIPDDAAEFAAIRRWDLSDFDDWFAHRLCHRWGGEPRVWRHKMMGFQSNDYLFITNGGAVMLAMVLRHVMTGRPVVMEIFAFARAAPEKDGVYGATQRTNEGDALKPLYQRLREWAKSMDATRIYVGVSSDILPSELRMMMGSESYYVVGAPCS